MFGMSKIHLATKAEVIIKNEFDLKVTWSVRRTIREKSKSSNGNEYDIAIDYLTEILEKFPVEVKYQSFVKEKIDIARKLMDYAKSRSFITIVLNNIEEKYNPQQDKYINNIGIGTKECPKCAEIIKAKALICRFCRYDFEKVELKNKSREIEDVLDNDSELDDFVQNQKDLKADIARELNQAKSQIDKIIIGCSGLLKQTTCITLGTFYDPHKSFPPLNNEQISWAFGLCDAYISPLNFDDEESLAYITVCFVNAYGDEMGSKYLGTALKNQIKFKGCVKQGGQSANDFLKNNIFPIMPKS